MASPTAAPRTPPPPTGWVIRIGLAVVLSAAAVLSFAALRDLALAVRIHAELAWLLPIAVDAGAAVSCSAWLTPRSPRDAARFARALTFGLLVLTVAGNAGAQGMAAAGLVPPWWVAVLVGAIPPAVVGGVVHLAVLVTRGRAAAGDTAPAEVPAEPLPLPPRDEVTPAPPALAPAAETSVPDRAAELIAEGAGRRRLARELSISEHAARALLDAHQGSAA